MSMVGLIRFGLSLEEFVERESCTVERVDAQRAAAPFPAARTIGADAPGDPNRPLIDSGTVRSDAERSGADLCRAGERARPRAGPLIEPRRPGAVKSKRQCERALSARDAIPIVHSNRLSFCIPPARV
jgi:hypothetical protein